MVPGPHPLPIRRAYISVSTLASPLGRHQHQRSLHSRHRPPVSAALARQVAFRDKVNEAAQHGRTPTRDGPVQGPRRRTARRPHTPARCRGASCNGHDCSRDCVDGYFVSVHGGADICQYSQVEMGRLCDSHLMFCLVSLRLTNTRQTLLSSHLSSTVPTPALFLAVSTILKGRLRSLLTGRE